MLYSYKGYYNVTIPNILLGFIVILVFGNNESKTLINIRFKNGSSQWNVCSGHIEKYMINSKKCQYSGNIVWYKTDYDQMTDFLNITSNILYESIFNLNDNYLIPNIQRGKRLTNRYNGDTTFLNTLYSNVLHSHQIEKPLVYFKQSQKQIFNFTINTHHSYILDDNIDCFLNQTFYLISYSLSNEYMLNINYWKFVPNQFGHYTKASQIAPTSSLEQQKFFVQRPHFLHCAYYPSSKYGPSSNGNGLIISNYMQIIPTPNNNNKIKNKINTSSFTESMIFQDRDKTSKFGPQNNFSFAHSNNYLKILQTKIHDNIFKLECLLPKRDVPIVVNPYLSINYTEYHLIWMYYSSSNEKAGSTMKIISSKLIQRSQLNLKSNYFNAHDSSYGHGEKGCAPFLYSNGWKNLSLYEDINNNIAHPIHTGIKYNDNTKIYNKLCLVAFSPSLIFPYSFSSSVATKKEHREIPITINTTTQNQYLNLINNNKNILHDNINKNNQIDKISLQSLLETQAYDRSMNEPAAINHNQQGEKFGLSPDFHILDQYLTMNGYSLIVRANHIMPLINDNILQNFHCALVKSKASTNFNSMQETVVLSTPFTTNFELFSMVEDLNIYDDITTITIKMNNNNIFRQNYLKKLLRFTFQAHEMCDDCHTINMDITLVKKANVDVKYDPFYLNGHPPYNDNPEKIKVLWLRINTDWFSTYISPFSIPSYFKALKAVLYQNSPIFWRGHGQFSISSIVHALIKSYATFENTKYNVEIFDANQLNITNQNGVLVVPSGMVHKYTHDLLINQMLLFAENVSDFSNFELFDSENTDPQPGNYSNPNDIWQRNYFDELQYGWLDEKGVIRNLYSPNLSPINIHDNSNNHQLDDNRLNILGVGLNAARFAWPPYLFTSIVYSLESNGKRNRRFLSTQTFAFEIQSPLEIVPYATFFRDGGGTNTQESLSATSSLDYAKEAETNSHTANKDMFGEKGYQHINKNVSPFLPFTTQVVNSSSFAALSSQDDVSLTNPGQTLIRSVKPGATFRLKCIGLGLPPPRVTWLKNGYPLSTGGKINIVQDPTHLMPISMRRQSAYKKRRKKAVNQLLTRIKRDDLSVNRTDSEWMEIFTQAYDELFYNTHFYHGAIVNNQADLVLSNVQYEDTTHYNAYQCRLTRSNIIQHNGDNGGNCQFEIANFDNIVSPPIYLNLSITGYEPMAPFPSVIVLSHESALVSWDNTPSNEFNAKYPLVAYSIHYTRLDNQTFIYDIDNLEKQIIIGPDQGNLFLGKLKPNSTYSLYMLGYNIHSASFPSQPNIRFTTSIENESHLNKTEHRNVTHLSNNDLKYQLSNKNNIISNSSTPSQQMIMNDMPLHSSLPTSVLSNFFQISLPQTLEVLRGDNESFTGNGTPKSMVLLNQDHHNTTLFSFVTNHKKLIWFELSSLSINPYASHDLKIANHKSHLQRFRNGSNHVLIVHYNISKNVLIKALPESQNIQDSNSPTFVQLIYFTLDENKIDLKSYPFSTLNSMGVPLSQSYPNGFTRKEIFNTTGLHLNRIMKKLITENTLAYDILSYVKIQDIFPKTIYAFTLILEAKKCNLLIVNESYTECVKRISDWHFFKLPADITDDTDEIISFEGSKTHHSSISPHFKQSILIRSWLILVIIFCVVCTALIISCFLIICTKKYLLKRGKPYKNHIFISTSKTDLMEKYKSNGQNPTPRNVSFLSLQNMTNFYVSKKTTLTQSPNFYSCSVLPSFPPKKNDRHKYIYSPV